MSSFVLPAVGLVLWTVHATRAWHGRSGGAARWLVLAGLPVASAGCFVWLALRVPPPQDTHVYAPPTHGFAVWAGNGFLGLGLWIVLLVMEPFVLLVAGRRRRSGIPIR